MTHRGARAAPRCPARRRAHRTGAIWIALVAVLGAGCQEENGDAGGETVEPSAVTASAVPEVDEMEAGRLFKGEHTASKFQVPFSVVTDDVTWDAQWVTPHLVNFGAPEYGSEVQVFVPTKVYEDGTKERLIEPPPDFVRWLASIPRLQVEKLGHVTVGGLDGTEVSLAVATKPSVLKVRALDPEDPNPQPYGFGINPGGSSWESTWRIFEEAVDGRPLIITYYAASKDFLPLMEELVSSMRFDTDR